MIRADALTDGKAVASVLSTDQAGLPGFDIFKMGLWVPNGWPKQIVVARLNAAGRRGAR